MNRILRKLRLSKANNLYDQALHYYQQGNFEEAIETFQKVISNPKKADICYNLSLFYIKESYLNLGFAYEHLGRYEEAVKNFTAVGHLCNFPDIHYHLGLCYCFLDEFNKAKQEFIHSLEINPKYTAALFMLGFTYVRLHEFKDAADCFQKALEINSHYADYHYWLGSLYGLQGKFDLAHKEFQCALAINPYYREAETKKILIEEARGSKMDGTMSSEWEHKVIDEFSRAFAVVPITNMESLAGTIQIPKGDNIISDIILFYEKAIRSNPHYADLHYHLGVSYNQKGAHDQAKEAFLKALKINPTYLQAMVNLALTYMKTGQIEEGIQTLKEAVALRPDYPDLHYYLGSLYAEKNDIAAAREEFEKVLTINPQYPECHLALAVLNEKEGQKEQALLHWHLYLKHSSGVLKAKIFSD